MNPCWTETSKAALTIVRFGDSGCPSLGSAGAASESMLTAV